MKLYLQEYDNLPEKDQTYDKLIDDLHKHLADTKRDENLRRELAASREKLKPVREHKIKKDPA